MPSAARAEESRPELRLVRGPRAAPGTGQGPAQGPGQSELFSGLRVVRTIAMLSIVGYHVTWEPIFGIAFGLTSLQIIMCALVARAERARPLAGICQKRATRLLAPWIAWSGVYALFEVGRHSLAGEGALDWVEPWMWIAGTSFHLWFLPFGFAASVTVNAALRLARPARPAAQATVAALAGAALLVAIDPLKRLIAPVNPFDLWIDGLPTLLFGIAVGRSIAVTDRVRRAALLLVVAALGLVPFVLGSTVLPASGLYERYAVAIPVVCLGLIVPVPDRRWMATLAATNLGVYLVHMLAIRVMDRLPAIASVHELARVAIAYGLCLLAVLAIRRTKLPHLA